MEQQQQENLSGARNMEQQQGNLSVLKELEEGMIKAMENGFKDIKQIINGMDMRLKAVERCVYRTEDIEFQHDYDFHSPFPAWRSEENQGEERGTRRDEAETGGDKNGEEIETEKGGEETVREKDGEEAGGEKDVEETGGKKDGEEGGGEKGREETRTEKGGEETVAGKEGEETGGEKGREETGGEKDREETRIEMAANTTGGPFKLRPKTRAYKKCGARSKKRLQMPSKHVTEPFTQEKNKKEKEKEKKK